MFESNRVVITKHGVFISKGYICDGFFKLSLMPFSSNKIYDSSSLTITNVESCDMWHARLGHINLNSIRRMMSLNLIPKYSIDLKKKCKICVQSKKPRKGFHTCMKKKTNLLELIHSDVCDSNDVLTRGGKRYFITFIDDFSKYCYVYLINHKHEFFEKFKIYKSEVENQLERTIKILRSDRGGEYTSLEMNAFVKLMVLFMKQHLPIVLNLMV